ncbi:MAG: RdgB/HAM1 family non-canonical purine NTP pyrophosphatase [Fervidobacterium sp.]|nr:RdgB/HAM1 family non-canonical purine NTP pyrophosphatase [Fervidobacterium sp.]
MAFTIYIASKNKHKAYEIKLVAPDFVELLNVDTEIDVVEDGETFLENSIIKAIEYGKYVNGPVIADDSGLSIKALDGFPGVMSARYMEGASYVQKMESILQLMKNFKSQEERKARFVCVASYYNPLNSFLVSVEGHVEGIISYQIRGDQGFGYDPIFVPDGYDKTFGELGEDVKKIISHRSIAFRKLFDILIKLGELNNHGK